MNALLATPSLVVGPCLSLVVGGEAGHRGGVCLRFGGYNTDSDVGVLLHTVLAGASATLAGYKVRSTSACGSRVGRYRLVVYNSVPPTDHAGWGGTT